LLAGVAVRAGDADALVAKPWTRTLQPHWSSQQLGLPASAAPRRLGRAALRRAAPRLGLPRSLRGVRLERTLHTPPGSAGSPALDNLRFQQTAGGRRVVWSRLDVTLAGGEVRLIDATVVPVGRGRPAIRPKVSRIRALAIARRTVRGRERAHAPQLVTYAGSPARGLPPRSAWLIETLPAAAARGEDPIGLCVVVDARSGRVLSTWRGHAARSHPDGTAPAVAARAAQGHRNRIILLRDARRPSREPPVTQDQQIGSPYAAFNSDVPAFTLANWDTTPALFSGSGAVFDPDLDAAIRNTRDVVAFMCFTRGFCSRDGKSDGEWEHTLVTGDIAVEHSFYDPFSQRVFLTRLRGYQNDAIAHELGHHIDQTFSGDDRVLDREVREVREAIGDMFAIDFDREDSTFGEDGPRGKNTEIAAEDWANGGRIGQPLRMSQYLCAVDDIHFNSMILSHAYYTFAQRVTPDVAGRVLYQVMAGLGPASRYVNVAGAFVAKAAATTNAQVAAAARQSFLVEGGIDKPPPTCSGTAPTPPPPPPPPPPSQVAVPNLRGETPGAASSELANVGLRLGTQTELVDNNCVAIGQVLSQTPTAGTLVAPGSAVDIKLGKLPSHPCP
jgi:PASTA domain